jgi:transglutaminase-like putative cysteine protease
VFASLLYDTGIWSGIYLIAFVWITTTGLLQLARGGGLLPSLALARVAGRLLLQAVPIMVVLFVLFPRLPGPLWGLPGDTSSGATGLSGEMSPGDITNLGLSDEVAFRVTFGSIRPSPSELYWRGPVLANFNGRTWSRDNGMRRRPGDSLEFRGEPVRYEISLEPNDRPWLFSLDMPAEWSTDSRRRTIGMGSDYQLRMFGAEARTSALTYTATSYTDYSAREPLSPTQRSLFTRLPPDRNPRTRELAETWAAESPEPRAIVERALGFLREQEFFYTLTPPPLGRETADEFLFETREGFCEHYASAFTILLRSADIPARVVTGYQGGELNSFGDYYIVRQSDAHAWTEVWFEDEGWVRVDPITAVAPERIALGIDGAAIDRQTARAGVRSLALARQLMQAWDTANTYWERWVVGYSFQLQRALIERLGFERPSLANLLAATIIAMIVLMLGLSVYLTARFRRESQRDPAARCFARFGRRLGRLRVEPMRTGETPIQYAERAARTVPAAAERIRAVVGAYLAARYEPDRDGAALAHLDALVRDFSRQSAPASR